MTSASYLPITPHRNFNNIQRYSVEISMPCVFAKKEADFTEMKRVSSPDIFVVPGLYFIRSVLSAQDMYARTTFVVANQT